MSVESNGDGKAGGCARVLQDHLEQSLMAEMNAIEDADGAGNGSA
jgi:hypothetical protein